MEVNEELAMIKRKLKEFEQSWDVYTTATKEIVGYQKYQEILIKYWEMQEKLYKTPNSGNDLASDLESGTIMNGEPYL